jgi:hypothetical protein
MKRCLVYTSLLLLTQCSKCKKDDPTPEQQLPPATQTGANTFGCLVNGQAYVTKGAYGTNRNVVQYDPTPTGAYLNIRTSNSPNDKVRRIFLAVGPVTKTGGFSLDLSSNEGEVSYIDEAKTAPCYEFIQSGTTYRRGTLTLTRLDEQAGIISGTFNFTLAKPGCDTVRVTNGRFDYKL